MCTFWIRHAIQGGYKITSFFSRTKEKPKPVVIESKDSDQLASEEEIFEEPMQSKPVQAKKVDIESQEAKSKGQSQCR